MLELPGQKFVRYNMVKRGFERSRISDSSTDEVIIIHVSDYVVKKKKHAALRWESDENDVLLQ